MEEDQCRVAEPVANRIEGNTLGFKSSLFRHENCCAFETDIGVACGKRDQKNATYSMDLEVESGRRTEIASKANRG